MWRWMSRILVAGWFVGMVVVAVRGMPVQGQGGSGEPKQYFPTLMRNAPVLAEPPLNGYVGLTVVGINEATELYTLRADGSEVRRLTTNSVAELDPQWSPNGNQIAFLQSIPDAPDSFQTMVMNRDGNGLQAIGSPKVGANGAVEWSPNGRYLLTVAGNSVPLYKGDLTLLGIDGTVDHFVASDIAYDERWYVGWSPNGQYFYYVSNNLLWIHTLATGISVSIGEVASHPDYNQRDTPQILWHPTSAELIFTTSAGTGVAVSPDGTRRRDIFTGGYWLGGWLKGGAHLLLRLHYQVGDDLYHVPYDGGSITPWVVRDGYYGVELGGIVPAGDAVLYQDVYNSGAVVLHPLIGEPQPLQGASCHTRHGGLCGIFSRSLSWATDGRAVMFTMGRGSYGGDTVYTVNYATLNEDTFNAIQIPSLQSPTLLPFSNTKGIAYKIYGYPSPPTSAPHLIDAPASTTMPLITDLGNYVDVVEWRYLP
jgi:hypothetical protein